MGDDPTRRAEQSQHRLDEFVKLRYDMVKHNTTLAAGVAVAIIALSQGEALPVGPLLLLALSGIAGLIAMPRIAGLLILEGNEREQANRVAYWAHNLSATTLVGALLLYAVNR